MKELYYITYTQDFGQTVKMIEILDTYQGVQSWLDRQPRHTMVVESFSVQLDEWEIMAIENPRVRA